MSSRRILRSINGNDVLAERRQSVDIKLDNEEAAFDGLHLFLGPRDCSLPVQDVHVGDDSLESDDSGQSIWRGREIGRKEDLLTASQTSEDFLLTRTQ